MTANRRLTRGRLLPFRACGHKGLGATCHRCEQGNALLARAEQFRVYVPVSGNVSPPNWLVMEAGGKYVIRGFSRSFVTDGKPNRIVDEKFRNSVADEMAKEAKRLLAKPVNKGNETYSS